VPAFRINEGGHPSEGSVGEVLRLPTLLEGKLDVQVHRVGRRLDLPTVPLGGARGGATAPVDDERHVEPAMRLRRPTLEHVLGVRHGIDLPEILEARFERPEVGRSVVLLLFLVPTESHEASLYRTESNRSVA